ncbi:rho-associated protein kinase 1-like [Macrobrachium rosenbergii]|uniref:rho-associated protein kinase 1-like n=1 Tax=Macrobrachium rosenbergii TaxID=79674 RepID=UPI0034D409D1
MDMIHQEIQLLKQHLEADQKALERVLERCQIHESNLEDALNKIQSLRLQIKVESFLMGKMENEKMQLKSSFKKEEEEEEEVRDIDTPLQHQDEEHLAEKHQLNEKLELERQSKEERKPGSLILRRLCERRGIVLSRALEKLWHENKNHTEKESEGAVENGSELNLRLKEGQDVNQELVAAHECQLKAPQSYMSELHDRSDRENSLVTEIKRNLNMQKIQDLESQVQCLRDLVAQREVEIYIATERLKAEREKNEDLANWIVGLGSEGAGLKYRITTRNVTITSEKKNNTILHEEVQVMKNTVAELEDENAELKMICQLAIWILDLIFIILLFTGFRYLNFSGN